MIQIVRQRHLEDKPDKHKIHKDDVPTLGGIGIFAGFLVGFLLGIDGYMPGLSYFAAAAVLLFFVGIKDDLVYLNPIKKVLGRVRVSCYYCFLHRYPHYEFPRVFRHYGCFTNDII